MADRWLSLDEAQAVFSPKRDRKAEMEARLSRKREHDNIMLAEAVNRDPCVGCAVPADRHDTQGCGRYIPKRY